MSLYFIYMFFSLLSCMETRVVMTILWWTIGKTDNHVSPGFPSVIHDLVNDLCIVGLGISGIKFLMFKMKMTFFYRTSGRINCKD